MGLQRQVALARRHRVALLVSLIVFPLLALTTSKLTTPLYESSAELFVSLKSSNTASDLNQGATYARDQMASYATLATTPAVLQPVITELALHSTVNALAQHVSATALNDTVVLQLTVSDPSPRQAAQIAGAVADQLIDVISEIAPRDNDGQPNVAVSEVAQPRVPQYASSPRTKENVALGLLLGIVVGVLYVVVREGLDTKVEGRRQLAELTDVPVLGSVAVTPGGTPQLPVVEEPQGGQAETFRQLATSVEFLGLGSDEALTLLITSAVPGEGKSRVAINVALALAEVGHKVLLVDADLRLPVLADRLGLEGTVGLSTVLLGRAGFDDVRQDWGPNGLHVLAAGAVPPNPVQLLSSPRMARLSELVAERYDVIIIDTPPVLPVTDTLVLSRHASGVVLVANTRKVRRGDFTEAADALARVEARLLGVIANMVPARTVAATYGYGDTGPSRPSRSIWRRYGRRFVSAAGEQADPSGAESPVTVAPVSYAERPPVPAAMRTRAGARAAEERRSRG